MRIPGQHDAVARCKAADARTEFGDFTGRLVAEHRRQRQGQGALDRLEIGVAQAGGADAHQHIARRQRPDLEPLDGHRPIGVSQNRGA